MTDHVAGQPAFLLALDAIVRLDGAAPGFAGTIAVGVDGPPVRWWVLEAGASAPTTRFTSVRPEAADAWLLFSAEDGRRLLSAGTPGVRLLEHKGGHGLIARFAARYATARRGDPRCAESHRSSP